jgi:hypothetical protein
MKIEVNTASYNSRRYGKPWIAKVDFANPKGDFTWGVWVGDLGDSGILVINAEPGDIIARGQRDHRGNGTSVHYSQVQEDGTRLHLENKAAAYKLWRPK